jgi:branched-chain amino acid transport system substrate-binding protein
MKAKRIFFLAATLIVIIAFFTCCSGSSSDKTNKATEPIKFGAVLPETGNAAQLGVPKKEAFLLAAENINASGGISGRKIEIVLGDNMGDPKTGINVMQKLKSVDGINLFYVDITGVAYACAPVADQLKVVMFAGSAHPSIADMSPWVFRVFTSGDQETEVLSNYLSAQKVKTVYVLHINDSLGEASLDYLKRKFEKQGGKVLGSETFKTGQQDCREILIKARDSKAEKIVIIDYGVTVPMLLQQAQELGIATNTIMGNIGFVGPRVAKLDQKLINDIVFTGPSYAYKYRSPDSQNMKAFVDGYKAKYAKDPDYTAAFAYDTLNILKEVISKVGDKPDAVKEGLLNVKDFQGVSGKISFKPNGDTITEVSLMTYKDGLAIPLEEK